MNTYPWALPEELPGDLFDQLRDTIRYYLQCSFDGVSDHPEVLKPEDWATGATLSVWQKLSDYVN